MRFCGIGLACGVLWLVAGCSGSGTQVLVEERFRGRIIGETGPMFSDEPTEDFRDTEEIDYVEWHYLADVGGFDAIVGWWHGFPPDPPWWELLGGMERSVVSPTPGVFVVWVTRDQAGALRADRFAFLRRETIHFLRDPSGIRLSGTGNEVKLRFSLSDVPGKSLKKPHPMKLEDGTPTGHLYVQDPTLVRLTGEAKVFRNRPPETPLEDRLRYYAKMIPGSELGKALARRLMDPRPIETLLPFLKEVFPVMGTDVLAEAQP